MSLVNKILLEAKGNKVIAYHASNKREREFDDKYDSGMNLFGQAFYFASTGMMDIRQFGKYVRKYELDLGNSLNFNSEMTNEAANQLSKEFAIFCKLPVPDYDFNEDFEGVLHGEFFEKVQEINDATVVYKFIKPFIQSKGYDSFWHYAYSDTGFAPEKREYKCYAVYDKKQIRIIEEDS